MDFGPWEVPEQEKELKWKYMFLVLALPKVLNQLQKQFSWKVFYNFLNFFEAFPSILWFDQGRV